MPAALAPEPAEPADVQMDDAALLAAPAAESGDDFVDASELGSIDDGVPALAAAPPAVVSVSIGHAHADAE